MLRCAVNLCLLVVLAAQAPRAGEEEAWKAALALKQQAPSSQAGAALAKFNADFPGSAHAVACAVEESVCWYSSGRNSQVLHRTTPAARAEFDKALALLEGVTRDHAAAPEAARAWYLKSSVHLLAGELELADTELSTVLDHFSDRDYVGKALAQRSLVRRQLLRSQDAIADLQRWIKDFGTPPEALTKAKWELARAQMLGKQAPLFKGETWFNGDPAPLELQSGNVVGLFFFATWCENCARELPFVLDLEHRYGPKGVHFIGVVDHERGQTPDNVRAHLAAKQIAFPVFQDDHAASTAYKVSSIPMLVLIDRDGILRWCDNPAILADSTLDKLLGESNDAPKK